MKDMEEMQSAIAPQPPRPSVVAICPQCHQPVLPTYFFCPNCGKNLKEPPLSTSAATQAGLYALSIIMPVICFLAINQWRGMKYLKSADPQAKQIGIVATVLMAVSTVIVVWLGIILTEQLVSSMTGGLMGAGNLGV
jgi:hypothetical protein